MRVGTERTGTPPHHVVQFYGSDAELAASAADYLAEGLCADEVAVVVATDAHHNAFETALTKRGVDVAAARASGCYIVLDAEQAMGRFLATWLRCSGTPDTSTPRSARNFVLETLHAWDEHPLLDDAALIVTELATNAVLHAGCAFTVDISCSPDVVRIAVHDPSSAQPELRDAPVAAISGRGLGIVAALAHQWDVESVDAGKTVWAELLLHR